MNSYFSFCPRCASKLKLVKEHREDAPIPTCPKCDFAFYNNPVGATDAVIVRQNKILLTKRARNPRKGYFDFPGGFLNGFETPMAGAKREVYEETGLRFSPKKIIGSYINTQYYWKGRFLPALCIAYLGTASGTIRKTEEVEEIYWLPINKTISMAFRYQNQILRDVKKIIRKQ